jgi:hypothetical protein
MAVLVCPGHIHEQRAPKAMAMAMLVWVAQQFLQVAVGLP